MTENCAHRNWFMPLICQNPFYMWETATDFSLPSFRVLWSLGFYACCLRQKSHQIYQSFIFSKHSILGHSGSADSPGNTGHETGSLHQRSPCSPTFIQMVWHFLLKWMHVFRRKKETRGKPCRNRDNVSFCLSSCRQKFKLVVNQRPLEPWGSKATECSIIY